MKIDVGAESDQGRVHNAVPGPKQLGQAPALYAEPLILQHRGDRYGLGGLSVHHGWLSGVLPGHSDPGCFSQPSGIGDEAPGPERPGKNDGEPLLPRRRHCGALAAQDQPERTLQPVAAQEEQAAAHHATDQQLDAATDVQARVPADQPDGKLGDTGSNGRDGRVRVRLEKTDQPWLPFLLGHHAQWAFTHR